MKCTIPPHEGIIVTILSEAIEGKGGYRKFLKDFFKCMENDDYRTVYWITSGAKPKHDVPDVYILISGRIRFKCTFVESHGPRTVKFNDGREIYGRGWVVITGPAERPPRPIYMKGFRGFRYTETLF